MAKQKKGKQIEQDVLMLTQSGYDELVQEVEYRSGELRDQIANEINEARNLGDLSENQAYSEAMEKKNMNEARIEELEQMVAKAQIIQREDKDVIGIGSTVEIESTKTSKSRSITIVGKGASQEADPRQGKISIDSPLGSALSGNKKGAIVKVVLPSGEAEYKVKKVA